MDNNSERIINLEGVLEIRVKDFKKSKDFKFLPGMKASWLGKLFGDVDREPGFYNWYCGYQYPRVTKEELESGVAHKEINVKYRVIDNEVYFRPYVQLFFANPNLGYVQEFDSYEEAVQWARREATRGIKENNKLIKQFKNNKLIN